MLKEDYQVICIDTVSMFYVLAVKLLVKSGLSNVDSPIPGFSSKIVPHLHGFT